MGHDDAVITRIEFECAHGFAGNEAVAGAVETVTANA